MKEAESETATNMVACIVLLFQLIGIGIATVLSGKKGSGEGSGDANGGGIIARMMGGSNSSKSSTPVGLFATLICLAYFSYQYFFESQKNITKCTTEYKENLQDDDIKSKFLDAVKADEIEIDNRGTGCLRHSDFNCKEFFQKIWAEEPDKNK